VTELQYLSILLSAAVREEDVVELCRHKYVYLVYYLPQNLGRLLLKWGWGNDNSGLLICRGKGSMAETNSGDKKSFWENWMFGFGDG
jgi:hypothetical protein